MCCREAQSEEEKTRLSQKLAELRQVADEYEEKLEQYEDSLAWCIAACISDKTCPRIVERKPKVRHDASVSCKGQYMTVALLIRYRSALKR